MPDAKVTHPYEPYYDTLDGHCLLGDRVQTRVIIWFDLVAPLLSKYRFIHRIRASIQFGGMKRFVEQLLRCLSNCVHGVTVGD